ncbi:MAG TPA: ABC transporter permease, partial [Candidatus Binatia bacterium]|nr:ABC transporter permease [Candidatus Binatia bacterium]
MLLMKIGWRNLWRNPLRTLLTMLALGLGLALLLLSLGLLDGSQEQRIADRVRLGAGHLVVQAKGYQDTHAQDLLLPAGVVPAIEKLLSFGSMQGSLREVSPRLLASGLLSSAADASKVSIFGVMPKTEASVSLVSRRIIAGTYLSDGQPAGVVIGAELARKLQVRVGSKVVLTIQAVRRTDARATDTPRGEMQSSLLRVRGIFRTGLRELDTYMIHLPLPAAQALLGAPEQVTQVALFLARDSDAPLAARLLREQLTAVPTEVLTWRESLVRLAQIFWLEGAFNYVISGILLVMVGLGVLN